MRPLALTVTGLRSHVGTTSVTFPDDWQLAAIVGPTGAGKSSLLEAIVYALFGSGTVPNASQPINLIADNTREMRVMLIFEVAGTVHEVVRAYRRSGASPPPVLKSPGQILSGVRPVEDAVTRLLGLSQDAFCQTALLPQGRFARLLEAGANDQKRTLDEFFRLSEVTDVANRIATASDQVEAGRERVAIVRRQLPSDPTADLAAAKHAMAVARAAASTAAALEAEVTKLLSDADKAVSRSGEHELTAAALDTAAHELVHAADQANIIAALAAEIERDESMATVAEDQARTALAAIHERISALDSRTVTAARATVTALGIRIREADAAIDDAARLDADALGADGRYQAVVAELTEASSDQQRLESVAADAEGAADRANELASLGEGLATACADTAQRLGSARTAAEQAISDLTASTEAARDARDAYEHAMSAAAMAEVQARQADELSVGAVDAAGVARDEADQIANLFGAFTDAATVDLATAAALADSTAVATEAHTASEYAAADRIEAKAAHDQAEAGLAHARRAEAAALAAADVHPGEPCPVCARELPNDFRPPAPPASLAVADKAVRAARVRLDEASDEAVRTRTRAEGAEQERSAAEQAATDAANHLAGVAALYDTAGGDTARRDSEEEAEAAIREAHRADESARHAHQQAAGATANLQARADARGPLDDARSRAERANAAARAALSEADRAAASATAPYRTFGGNEALAQAQAGKAVAMAAALEFRAAASTAQDKVDQLNEQHGNLRVAAGNARTAALAAADHGVRASAAAHSAAMEVPAVAYEGKSPEPREILAAATDWTAEREAQLEAADLVAAEVQASVEESEAKLATARRRRTTEHDSPLAALTTTAAGLAATVRAPMPPSSDAAALSAWATDSAATATGRAANVRDAANNERGEAAKVRGAASDKCQAAGTSVEELATWRAEADAAVGRAQTSHAQAESAAARCSELDRALESTAARGRLLEAGKTLSRGRGNFVLHVLAARRHQLVVEAAAILADLSGERLVFDTDATDRFSVIDTSTATARDPRLLSGGEQFQASLALALGLVEIAARGGSRIECLFLDEGFAALDNRSLDIALDALETAARRGRRIVAVTHIDSVTTRCDQVLEVRPGTRGSNATWRQPALV
jgi:exonuclease SbcC